MAIAVIMDQMSVVLYVGFFIIGFIIWLNLTGKAFNEKFIYGLQCLFFPIGTYFYCKNSWQEKRTESIAIIICCAGAILFKLTSMFLG